MYILWVSYGDNFKCIKQPQVERMGDVNRQCESDADANILYGCLTFVTVKS